MVLFLSLIHISKVALANFRDGIDSKAVTDKALSNGSAMRIAPIGCLFNTADKERIANFVYGVSEVTHTTAIIAAPAIDISLV